MSETLTNSGHSLEYSSTAPFIKRTLRYCPALREFINEKICCWCPYGKNSNETPARVECHYDEGGK